MSKKMTLALFLADGMSLTKWEKLGLLAREKRIYEEHLKRGHYDYVYWFTYDYSDISLREKMITSGALDSRIIIFPIVNEKGKKRSYCELSAVMQNIDIIKTDQMDGAMVAYKCAKKYKKKLLLRTGYTISSFKRHEISEVNGINKIKKIFWYIYYKQVEKFLYARCDRATVSSMHDYEYITNTCEIDGDRLFILPNYIDCDLFKPLNMLRENRFLFVGRLDKQKNLENIVKAFRGLDIGLDIIGEGCLQEKLRQLKQDNGVDIKFIGKVDNSELPLMYNSYRYYLLASLYEGMPKTLLEAMACGCICLGTNVEGIKEVLTDGDNGFIIDNISASAIQEKIKSVIENSDISDIAVNAEKYVTQKHSLDSVVMTEYVITLGTDYNKESIKDKNE